QLSALDDRGHRRGEGHRPPSRPYDLGLGGRSPRRTGSTLRHGTDDRGRPPPSAGNNRSIPLSPPPKRSIFLPKVVSYLERSKERSIFLPRVGCYLERSSFLPITGSYVERSRKGVEEG